MERTARIITIHNPAVLQSIESRDGVVGSSGAAGVIVTSAGAIVSAIGVGVAVSSGVTSSSAGDVSSCVGADVGC